jgi:hypothetical protein
MSPLSILISLQKSEHSISMNIAKVLNGKLFQSFHNVKGERILSCDVMMHSNVLNNVGWIYQWNLKCTLALVFGTKKWTRLAEPLYDIPLIPILQPNEVIKWYLC